MGELVRERRKDLERSSSIGYHDAYEEDEGYGFRGSEKTEPKDESRESKIKELLYSKYGGSWKNGGGGEDKFVFFNDLSSVSKKFNLDYSLDRQTFINQIKLRATNNGLLTKILLQNKIAIYRVDRNKKDLDALTQVLFIPLPAEQMKGSSSKAPPKEGMAQNESYQGIQLSPCQYSGNAPVGDVDIDCQEGRTTPIHPTVQLDQTNVDYIRSSRMWTEVTATSEPDKIDLKKFLSPRTPKDDPNATFLNPDYRNSFEKEQSKKQLNAYKFDKAYEKFIKEGQQRDPFNFGGGEFGMGMSKTLETASKEGALMVTGDYLFAKSVQIYRHLKHAKHLKKADDVVENVNKIDDFANHGDEISSGERVVPQEYSINPPKGILGSEVLTVVDDAAKGLDDLVGFRKEHILNRHRSGAGQAGKTEFPSNWSDDKIISEVNKIANNPNAPGGVGKWNSPYKTGTVDGVEIRVDFYPPTHPMHAGKVSTAYPTNTTPNPIK